jgi:hypothetical protein
VPCTCSVAAPPWAQVLGLCPGLPQVQARERGRVPCPLSAPHFFLRRDQKKIFEGNAITFLLISRTALRAFFAILTTHRRNVFSALEGLLRPGALASIGLTATGSLAPPGGACDGQLPAVHGRVRIICMYHPGFLSCTSGFLRPFAPNYVHRRAVLISSSAKRQAQLAHMAARDAVAVCCEGAAREFLSVAHCPSRTAVKA